MSISTELTKSTNQTRSNISAWWNKSYCPQGDTDSKVVFNARQVIDDYLAKYELDNAIMNMGAVHLGKSIKSIFGTHTGDALVIGSGPSCRDTKTIKKIRKNKSIIIVVDRAYETIMKAGIEPDYVVSTDSAKHVGDFLKDITLNDKVIMSVRQNPGVINEIEGLAGEMLFYTLVNPFSDVALDVRGIYGTVYDGAREARITGATAQEIAYWMGATRIHTLGCECGWLDEDDIEPYYREKAIPTFTKDDMMIWTIPAFYWGARAMEAMSLLSPGAEFIDHSGGLLRYGKVKFKEVN
jgi:hypothetical protein